MSPPRLSRHRMLHEERGIAMIVALGLLLVASVLIGVMFNTVLREQTSTARERNITNGRQAAEAGVDKVIFELSQNPANWDDYVTKYPCVANPSNTSPPSTCYSGTITSQGGLNASYVGSIKNDPVDSANYRVITMRGMYPAGRGGDQRVLRVRVQKTPPDAFKYAMFASRGIDIHHHAASYLSPQVVTTAVHSNGYMKIDYSAEFTLDTLEVVGLLTFNAGGGQYPAGNIPANGYSWYDPLNKLCYPGDYPNSTAGRTGATGTYPNVVCPQTTLNKANQDAGLYYNNGYSGNAEITGNIEAGQVKMGSRAIVRKGSALTLATHTDIGERPGNIHTSRFQGPTGNPLFSNGDKCAVTVCNRGAAVQPGQVAGDIRIEEGYAPKTVPFPVIQYPSYKAAAAAQGHEYATCSAFLTAITGNGNSSVGQTYFKKVDPTTGALVGWNPGDGMPDVIFLGRPNQATPGNPSNAAYYYIDSGGCTFDWDNIRTLTAKTACNNNNNFKRCGGNGVPATNAPAPMLMIQGYLVVPGGGITAQAPLAVIGPDNPTDFVIPADGTTTPATPLSVNESKLLAVGPSYGGVMAAGGTIDSHDYDSDSKWLPNTAYEWWKASPVYIRGLDMSATYVDTKTMTPQNQHFHNDDPKNFIKVFGAQVGSTLHNCMNFTFMYDPVVKNTPFATSPGTVKVADYQELQPGSAVSGP